MAFKRSGVRLPYAPPKPQLTLRFFYTLRIIVQKPGVEPGPAMNDVPAARQNWPDRAPPRRERRLPYAPPRPQLSLRFFLLLYKNRGAPSPFAGRAAVSMRSALSSVLPALLYAHALCSQHIVPDQKLNQHPLQFNQHMSVPFLFVARFLRQVYCSIHAAQPQRKPAQYHA